MSVPREPVELGDDQHRSLESALLEGLEECRAIVPLSAFDLGELRGQGPAPPLHSRAPMRAELPGRDQSHPDGRSTPSSRPLRSVSFEATRVGSDQTSVGGSATQYESSREGVDDFLGQVIGVSPL
jgi:hypothetical protein